MLKSALLNLKKVLKKYRKIVMAVLIIYGFWSFGLGVIGGWFLAKGTISSFPAIISSDRILILAPHIDDEVIATGGLIQEIISVGAQTKVIYMTNGDDSTSTIVTGDKNIGYEPSQFAELGEIRMKEGKAASERLGLGKSDIIFLGYPDKGLNSMLNNFFDKPYTAKGTRFNHNPYSGTFSKGQEYTGANLVSDLTKICLELDPTIIIAPHPRDKHSDHRATYRFIEKVQEELDNNAKLYSYLVHYSLYPPKKRLENYSFMYPPKNLFTKEGWYSYDLSSEQQEIKLSAIEQNESQLKALNMGGFLKSFVRKNEIFELMN